MFFHSSSFMGNPLSCAAANASLRIWEDDEAAQDKIDNIAKSHAEAAVCFARRGDMTNIRQKGTMLAMDLVVEDGGYLSEIQPKLYESFLSQGVLLRPLGNTVYILPPYCISEDDLDAVYSAVNVALDENL